MASIPDISYAWDSWASMFPITIRSLSLEAFIRPFMMIRKFAKSLRIKRDIALLRTEEFYASRDIMKRDIDHDSNLTQTSVFRCCYVLANMKWDEKFEYFFGSDVVELLFPGVCCHQPQWDSRSLFSYEGDEETFKCTKGGKEDSNHVSLR